MKLTNALLSFSLTILIISCGSHNTSKQIIIKGIILDGQTNKPIPNARVTLLSWRKVRFDEETYDKVDTTANSQGFFEATFTESFKVDIGSTALSYHPTVKEVKDINKTSTIELRLKRNTATGILKDLGQLGVFVRDYNTNPPLLQAYYGIDLLNGTNTQSLDSMDISAEKRFETKYPTILIANKKGGVIPIFNKSKDAICKAPVDGYLSKYELNGKEEGFFVKCRDGKTYARIMIFSREYNRSSPYKDGSFNDNGIMFNAELQTEGTEFNSTNNMRLDYYILENI